MRRRLALLALLPLAAVLTGCPFDNFGPEERACNAILVNITLAVGDASGASVTPTSATVERADGTSLVCPISGDRPASGCVVPLDKYSLSRIEVVNDFVKVSPTGETIRVGAAAGNLRGTADVVVRHDGCHVQKVSGPDVLVLR